MNPASIKYWEQSSFTDGKFALSPERFPDDLEVKQNAQEPAEANMGESKNENLHEDIRLLGKQLSYDLDVYNRFWWYRLRACSCKNGVRIP